MPINIFTLQCKNFGDSVNKRFWSYITNSSVESNTSKIHYITTGSIMCLVNDNSIIFGTGFISKDSDIGGGNFNSATNIKYITPSQVIAVRGPLSRDKMLQFDIDCPENYGDPLLLMPCIYDKKTNITKNIIGIIPHYVDKNNKNYFSLKECLEKNGYIVKYIDIEIGDKFENIIDDINTCKYIISSSLHGVIMGIVYKKNTIFLEFSNNVIGDAFKFQDFFKSINVNYIHKNIYSSDILDNIILVDDKYLQNIGIKLISLIPFINDTRKQYLTEKYIKFYMH